MLGQGGHVDQGVKAHLLQDIITELGLDRDPLDARSRTSV